MQRRQTSDTAKTKMTMSRLDVYAAEHQLYSSRERAKRAIRDGLVRVNGEVVTKASFDVSETDRIEADADPVPFVSRGGLKLEGAFSCFSLDVTGQNCLDVGASTGGFTQLLLQKGAARVTAVDVGHGQMDDTLRADPRVICLEGTDIRKLSPAIYAGAFDFASIDVSFISLTYVLPSVYTYLRQGGVCVALIKPQFELGSKALNKKGVVKDSRQLPLAVEAVTDCARFAGFAVEATVPSPIKGGDGNTEFLALLLKP